MMDGALTFPPLILLSLSDPLFGFQGSQATPGERAVLDALPTRDVHVVLWFMGAQGKGKPTVLRPRLSLRVYMCHSRTGHCTHPVPSYSHQGKCSLTAEGGGSAHVLSTDGARAESQVRSTFLSISPLASDCDGVYRGHTGAHNPESLRADPHLPNGPLPFPW